MLAGPLVFLDVDTQRDFLEPGGALYLDGSAAIRPNLARLARFARDRGIPVLATACAHEPGDPEFATFPPHCLLGTPGQGRIAETDRPGGPIVEPGGPTPAGVVPHLVIHKTQYDVFSNKSADAVFDLYAADRPTFVVYGVATDYCVRCAVDGLLDRGRAVALVVDAVWAVDPAAEPDLLTGFARRGALLTVTDVVTQPSTAMA